MDIIEIKKKKLTIEVEIHRLILRFSEQTTLTVKGVSLEMEYDPIYGSSRAPGVCTGVLLDVVI